MQYFRTVLQSLLFLIFAFASHAVMAQACSDLNGVPINQSHRLDRTIIEQNMLNGCDPPVSWIKTGGVNRSIGAKEMGTGPVIQTQRKPADEAPPFYEGEGCTYRDGNPMEGGASANGATQGACGPERGDGAPSFGPPGIIQIAMPDLLTEQMECLTNLFNGNVFGAVTGAVSANGGFSGACISGSLSVCGITAGGEACAGQRGLTSGANLQITNVEYVTIGDRNQGIHGPAVVTADTTMILPDGNIVNIPANSIINHNENTGDIEVSPQYGNYTERYNISGSIVGARLNVPQQGFIDLDPDLFNENSQYNLTHLTAPAGQGVQPPCILTNSCN